MTSERAKAYGRVTRIIDSVGDTKLHAPEVERMRHAADSLFFCDDLSNDSEARQALADVSELLHGLVEGDRWLPETAEELGEALIACGPATAVSS